MFRKKTFGNYIFKCKCLDIFNRFGFKEQDRYVFNQMGVDGYVKHMKTKLQLLGLDNHIQNVYEVLNGKISKQKDKLKENLSEMNNWLLYIKLI